MSKMLYISTRGNYPSVSSAQAIKLGMVPAGGLFVPEKIPVLQPEEVSRLSGLSYQELASYILGLYLDDYTEDEIADSVKKAYNLTNFDHPEIAPLKKINKHTYVMELWHGPTAAFKDMALQIMPQLLGKAIGKSGSDREIVILVATSGDTGKAALEGFKNVPGVKIIVFFPYRGVSRVQELQMTTTDGTNTYAVAVKGNFDDCQSAVKAIFSDQQFKTVLDNKGYELSSANSINWGRLLPQIVYYFHAYTTLLKQEAIKKGEKINFVVPTGNFGNILAGWYAFRMGLPVDKLICASNENKVLTDFFRTGVYDRNREFKQTSSPSMDILISSNLERFLFEMAGHNGDKINRWMKELNESGSFTVDPDAREDMDAVLWAGFASEEETFRTIRDTFRTAGYALDTHTAVGMNIYEKYVEATQDLRPTVIDATASPFKFNSAVLQAMKGPESTQGKDEFAILSELSRVTGEAVHQGLVGLENRPVLHNRVCEKTEIKRQIEEILGL